VSKQEHIQSKSTCAVLKVLPKIAEAATTFVLSTYTQIQGNIKPRFIYPGTVLYNAAK